MELTETIIRDTYKKLKGKADYYFDKGKTQKGLLYTHLAAYTNYTFWLSYSDKDIEDLVKKAGKSIQKKEFDTKGLSCGRCVMLDSLARYRGGLTVQYVNAIVSAGWKLLYISGQELQAPHHIELYNYLSLQKGVEILEIPRKLCGAKRLQFVYDSILNYGASKVYLHCTTTDILFPAVSYSLPSCIQKFYIDMADHGFRVGLKSCDFAFEFRNLGCSIVKQAMDFPEDKILMLPFYPVLDNIPFKGLPSQCNGKIKILSGGIFWKIVDDEDTFFRLCKKLLEQAPNSIILFPGSGDPTFVINKIKEYCMEDRFLLLGWRDDISEVFRNADIFLNTYPHGGATMSQYAAHAKVPILSYQPENLCPNPVENFVCQVKQTEVSSIGETLFLNEAHRLITNEDYRKEKAEKVFSCILNKDLFNKYFKKMSEEYVNTFSFSVEDNIDILRERLDKKIHYHNETGEYQMRLVSYLGLNSITLKRYYMIPFINNILPKLWRVIKKRGFHFNRI